MNLTKQFCAEKKEPTAKLLQAPKQVKCIKPCNNYVYLGIPMRHYVPLTLYVMNKLKPFYTKLKITFFKKYKNIIYGTRDYSSDTLFRLDPRYYQLKKI